MVARDAQKETLDVLLCVVRAPARSLIGQRAKGALSVVEAGAEPALTGGAFIDLLPATMKPAGKWGQVTRINLALGTVAAALYFVGGLAACVAEARARHHSDSDGGQGLDRVRDKSQDL